MRRLLAGGFSLAVLAVLSFALVPAHGSSTSDADGRIDVIFDTAKGIVPGQVVKIAGARVGTVKDVELTPDYKARLKLQMESQFTPFHTDAQCSIEPEGLISENFVQCDPGSPSAPVLKGTDDNAPTVPVSHTSVPVNLTDLFEIWDVPTRDRLRVLLNTLGAGVAARGPDINSLVRRANPTLGLVQQATTLLNGQRDALKASIVQAHDLTQVLAKRPEDLQKTITESAKVTQDLSEVRPQLAAGLQALPGALAAARPALLQLENASEQGAPLARRLGAAAPQLNDLLAAIPPAAKTALPAVKSLGNTAKIARPVVKEAQPVVTKLDAFARQALPTGRNLDTLLTSLKDRGFVEGLLSFVYYATAATSRYDGLSHILAIHANLSSCASATTTTAACDANYHRDGSSTAARKTTAADKTAAAQDATDAGSQAPSPSSGGSDQTPSTSIGPIRKPGVLPGIHLPIPTPKVPDVTVPLGTTGGGGVSSGQASSAANNVLDFLLGG